MNDSSKNQRSRAMLWARPGYRRFLELTAEVGGLSSRIGTVQAEIKAAQTEIEEKLTAAIEALRGEISRRLAGLAAKEQVAPLEAERDALYNELIKERATLGTKIEASQTEIEEKLTAAIEALRGEIGRRLAGLAAKEQVAPLEAERDALYNELINERATLGTKIEASQTEIVKKLRKWFDEMRADIESRLKALDPEGRVTALVAERDALYHELVAERASFSSVRARLQSEINKLQEEIEEFRSDKKKPNEQIKKWRSLYEREVREHSDLKERWNKVRLRPILFTTMPKSGTYYISNYLAKGLGVKTTIVSNQYFPHDTIRYQALKDFSFGNCVSQDHFGASEINLTHIGNFSDRLVCHVRDPRQAMLSYIHFIDAFRHNEETFAFIYPPLPRDFFARPLNRRIDWGIENWLPLLIQWTEEWISASKRKNGLKIMFTHYEDFIREPEPFARSVLRFFGIKPELFQAVRLEQTEELHFRKGETDEWRNVFSKAQRSKATALISPDLAKQMGWKLDL